MTIGIIDMDMGNIGSVSVALNQLGVTSRLVKKVQDLQDCKGLILPGVGAFPEAMSRLTKSGLVEPIQHWAADEKLLIGICLGMQLLMSSSTELGGASGLDLVKGKVVGFKNFDPAIRIPHVGWNFASSSEGLEKSFNDDYYFVHSYLCVPEVEKDILFSSTYEGIDFCSAVRHGPNIFGFQFHPEKSQTAGLNLLRWALQNAEK